MQNLRFDVAAGYIDGHTCVEKQKFEVEPYEELQDFHTRIFEWIVNQTDQLIEDSENDDKD